MKFKTKVWWTGIVWHLHPILPGNRRHSLEMFHRDRLSIQVRFDYRLHESWQSINRWIKLIYPGQTRARNNSGSGNAGADSAYSNKGGSFLQRISNRFSKRWVIISVLHKDKTTIRLSLKKKKKTWKKRKIASLTASLRNDC